jgi:hypothetical protein
MLLRLIAARDGVVGCHIQEAMTLIILEFLLSFDHHVSWPDIVLALSRQKEPVWPSKTPTDLIGHMLHAPLDSPFHPLKDLT